MAVGQHKLSRRALLGAVCAAPAVAVIPADAGIPGGRARSGSPRGPGFELRSSSARRDDGRWERALAGFAAAEAALAAATGASDEVYDPIGARHEAALRRLLRTPAPDVAALAKKLELALDERSGEFFGDEKAMRAVKRDARQLAAWTA